MYRLQLRNITLSLLLLTGFNSCVFVKDLSNKVTTTFKSITSKKTEKNQNNAIVLNEINGPGPRTNKVPLHNNNKANPDKSVNQNNIN